MNSTTYPIYGSDIIKVLNSFFIAGIELTLLKGFITLKILIGLKLGTPGNNEI